MSEPAIPALPVASDSLWTLLRTTPLRDALRGRLTGSLDVRRSIASANLPEPLPGLIYLTVRHARLSRAEQLRAARELIAGARRILDAGRSPEQFVASFGEPETAARLIRRERRLLPFTAIGLPHPLAELIYTVVRRTRLWRSERIDVARELAMHFGDGTDAGRTPEELVGSFGDARQAARLIRRAKLRNRPLAWRASRRLVQATLLFVLIAVSTYGFSWVRYVTARPNVAHNYELELNATSRAVPQADRAWPLCREAALRMTPEPHDESLDYSAAVMKPLGKHWKFLLPWVAQNRAALEIIRQAANRPHLGFVYGDPADLPWLEKAKIDPATMEPDRRNAEMFSRPLPQIQELGNLFHLILADAHRAVTENDAESFVHDIEASVGLANQVRGDEIPFFVSDAFSFSVLENTLKTVDAVLAEQSNWLSDDDLRRLAHCLAAYAGGGPIHCRLSGERAMMRDLYQRIYTDDGHGGGRLTPDGLQILDRLKMLPKSKINWALTPLLCEWLSSRREINQLTDELFDRLNQEVNRPVWPTSNSVLRDLVDLSERSQLDKIRYAPLGWMWSVANWAFSGNRITQLRDATLVALALELYRRRNGEWPKRLDELVPDLLPAVPPDQFTGGPLLYKVIDGRPLIYSAGPDKKDDGGRPVSDAALVHFFPPRAGEPVPQGDLILWPPQVTTRAGE